MEHDIMSGTEGKMHRRVTDKQNHKQRQQKPRTVKERDKWQIKERNILHFCISHIMVLSSSIKFRLTASSSPGCSEVHYVSAPIGGPVRFYAGLLLAAASYCPLIAIKCGSTRTNLYQLTITGNP